jgi:biopolymer transport protein ExbD
LESAKNQFIRLKNSRSFFRRRRFFVLRMAPMIDVIFLLLIFFLVAARYRPQEDFLPLKIAAARAEVQPLARPEPLMIKISPAAEGCEVQIGRCETIGVSSQNIDADLVLLMQQIQGCLTQQKRFTSDPVEIVCGPDVKWEYLAKIYNVFYGLGLTDITFAMTE